MKKFIKILLAISLTISIFSVIVYAAQATKIPREVNRIASGELATVRSFLEKEYDLSPDEKVEIGDVYRLSYIKHDFYNNYDKSIGNVLFESDNYLVIINAGGESFSYMQIGLQDGKYGLQMYGGNAKFFDETKKTAIGIKNDVEYFTNLYGRYSFVLENGEVIMTPMNNNEAILSQKVFSWGSLIKEYSENAEKLAKAMSENKGVAYGENSKSIADVLSAGR